MHPDDVMLLCSGPMLISARLSFGLSTIDFLSLAYTASSMLHIHSLRCRLLTKEGCRTLFNRDGSKRSHAILISRLAVITARQTYSSLRFLSTDMYMTNQCSEVIRNSFLYTVELVCSLLESRLDTEITVYAKARERKFGFASSSVPLSHVLGKVVGCFADKLR